MKVILVLVLSLFVVIGIACADEQTNRVLYQSSHAPSSFMDYVNSQDCFYGTYTDTTLDNAFGAEVNLNLYQFGPEAQVMDNVYVRGNIDFENDNRKEGWVGVNLFPKGLINMIQNRSK